MDYEQQRIPMPVIGVQVSLVKETGKGWCLVKRTRRQDVGWMAEERYEQLTTDEALDVALTLLELVAREMG